jgi:glutamate-1-semialdehyde aminotransferase
MEAIIECRDEFYSDNLGEEVTWGMRESTSRGFFNQLLAQGIYWPPSQFEAAFVSLAHSDEDIAYTVTAAKRAIGHLQN